jgi:hypothetical protein
MEWAYFVSQLTTIKIIMYMPKECNPFIKSMDIKFHDLYGIDRGCSSPNGLMFFNSIIWHTSYSLIFFFYISLYAYLKEIIVKSLNGILKSEWPPERLSWRYFMICSLRGCSLPKKIIILVYNNTSHYNWNMCHCKVSPFICLRTICTSKIIE